MAETSPKSKDTDKFLKKSISNIDLSVLAFEINQVLQDSFIVNVYEIPENELLIFKCRTKDGKKNIVIDLKKRINLTDYEYPVPPFPSQFIVSLRKFIKGRRIERVYQYNLDRIIILQLRSSEGPSWKFVVEFFDGGNFIILDGTDTILMAKHYIKKENKREILAKRQYEFPPAKGTDLTSLNFDTFQTVMKENKGDLVRILARNFNIGGYIAEEICLNAGIDKLTDVAKLSAEQQKLIYEKIETFIKLLQSQQYSPRILFNAEKQPISFEPFAYNLYQQYGFESKPTFNFAIDEFFSKYDSDTIYAKDVKEAKTQMTKTEKILNSQIAKIEESKEIREKSLEQAHVLYQYIPLIDNLISTIMTQRRDKKREWDDITAGILKGKEKQIPECMLFEKIYPQEVMVEISLEGTKFKLDLRKTAIENATDLYDEAKKAKRKIIGAIKAVEESKAKLSQEKEFSDQAAAAKRILIKRPPTKWYEKFRWFISSDGFLVVGGRDASSNEVVVKKYMKGKDLFFHTTHRGAPVCIIQNPDNVEIPEMTLNETATFDVSYSSAWREGWGNADIYYVFPEQVSKTPKAGEYLSKGSFYITGKKNMVGKPYLELAIGVKLLQIAKPGEDAKVDDELEQESERDDGETDIEVDENDNDEEKEVLSSSEDESANGESENPEDPKNNQLESEQGSKEAGQNLQKSNSQPMGELSQYFPQIISGPVSAIKKQIDNYIVLKPTKSRTSTSDLAKKILKKLISQATEQEQPWVKLASLNDIIRMIPSGDSEMVAKK